MSGNTEQILPDAVAFLCWAGMFILLIRLFV